MITIESLEALAQDGSGARLLEEVGRTIDAHPLLPADIERWRRTAPAPLVAAAVDVAMARQSLRGRIAAADAFWADRAGAMQATDDASAAWKVRRSLDAVRRIRESGELPDGDAPLLADYCCGAGADLAQLALALDGRAEGADLREERAWMARRNAHVPVHVADVRSWRSSAPLAHVDPSRRDEGSGSRAHGWSALEPGPDALAGIIGHHAGVMVKLGPGTDVPPEARPAGSELVHLSRDGTLTQALLCTGAMADCTGSDPDSRSSHEPGAEVSSARQGGAWGAAARAVLLRAGHDPLECAGPASWVSGRGARDWEPAASWGCVVAEPDASLERSGLLPRAAAVLGLAEVHAGLGLCTDVRGRFDADATTRSPWWRIWEVLAVVPGRLDAVQSALASHQPGIVEVKVRGGAAPADDWSRSLRGNGSVVITVFVHRTRAGGVEAVVARRRG